MLWHWLAVHSTQITCFNRSLLKKLWTNPDSRHTFAPEAKSHQDTNILMNCQRTVTAVAPVTIAPEEFTPNHHIALLAQTFLGVHGWSSTACELELVISYPNIHQRSFTQTRQVTVEQQNKQRTTSSVSAFLISITQTSEPKVRLMMMFQNKIGCSKPSSRSIFQIWCKRKKKSTCT